MAKKPSKNLVKQQTQVKAKAAPPVVPAASRSAQILKLLQRPDGTSIPELMKATGWQAHSIRGFISGTLKKKQGLTVTSTVVAGKDRRYHTRGEA